MVGACIPGQPHADGREIGVQPDVWWNWNDAAAIGCHGNKRTSCDKSRSHKKFPANAAQELPKERLTGLIKGQLEVRGNSGAVDVVVYVAMDEASCDLIGILFQKELPSDSKSAASVVRNEACASDSRRWRDLVVLTERENIAKDRYDARSDSGARYWKRRNYERSATAELLLLFLRLWLGFAGVVDCGSCAAAFGEFSCETDPTDDCSACGLS